MSIPEPLHAALTADGGGKLVIVVGAGCSLDPPTNLELSRVYARRAYERLVDAGTLTEDECSDPDDLSAVADAVFARHGTQQPVVDRLPRDDFANAQPNEGYRLAAALLREGVVRAFITLNYDLAIAHALPEADAGSTVAVLRGPEDLGNQKAFNVVFLHRSVYSPADEWVMRSDQLLELWQGGWEELVAQGLISAPVTVFAGLGSPAAVLTESVKRIRSVRGGNNTSQFLVTPGDADGNAFFQALEIPVEHFLSMGWVEFMVEASGAVVRDQVRRLGVVAQTRADELKSAEDFAIVIEALNNLSLISLGRLRARWLLTDRSYLPAPPTDGMEARAIADLVLTVALFAKRLNGTVWLTEDGVAEFRSAAGNDKLIFAHGGGMHSRDAVVTRLERSAQYRRQHHPSPRRVVAAGLREIPATAPVNLVRDVDATELVRGEAAWEVVSIEAVRVNPTAEWSELAS